MSKVVSGSKDTKTVIFPSSVRETSEDAFSNTSVQSVVLNEGLETIGVKTFCNNKIKRIIIPKSVTKIDGRAFESCVNLGKVVFEESSRRKTIGDYCF